MQVLFQRMQVLVQRKVVERTSNHLLQNRPFVTSEVVWCVEEIMTKAWSWARPVDHLLRRVGVPVTPVDLVEHPPEGISSPSVLPGAYRRRLELPSC